MTTRHANISVFVPHIGCPNMCSFCNQRYITGINSAPQSGDVINAVRVAAKSPNFDPLNTEIAFFGGSFTAINSNYMLELLKTANSFVKNRIVSGIRISTRPDAIDNKILSLLKEYGVTSIELGAQSLNDKVLLSNNRGHTVADVVSSSKMIKEYGFELGLQMMTGLFNDCPDYDISTAEKIIELQPDTVRIYPTIVLKNTDLAALYYDKKYKPQTLEEAVTLCSKLLVMFKNAGINVIRLGLHSIEGDSYIAGPWHPAFSELCHSKILLDKVLQTVDTQGEYNIYVNPSSVSKMIGQHKNNIVKLNELGFQCKVKTDSNLNDYSIRVERR